MQKWTNSRTPAVLPPRGDLSSPPPFAKCHSQEAQASLVVRPPRKPLPAPAGEAAPVVDEPTSLSLSVSLRNCR